MFDAKLAGEVFEVEEGDRRLITHAGLVIGNSLLMFAEAQVAEEFVAGETGRPVGGSSADSLVVQVADVDATLARAEARRRDRPARPGMNPTAGRAHGGPVRTALAGADRVGVAGRA